jgi:LysM repeat protein
VPPWNVRIRKQFVAEGHLVRVEPGQHFDLHDVSHPYARPAIKTFIDRLSAQYHAACGEKLTVTSLTRPIDKQPANASSDSVHPTGMAVDLRVPSKQNCRSWLERTLLSLEGTGVLDVTRERRPAHYHVAVFARTYENYLASLDQAPSATVVAAVASQNAASVTAAVASTSSARTAPSVYTVKRGDTLSTIADKLGTTVSRLRAANGLRGSMIRVGQKLDVPATAAAAPAQVAVASTETGNDIGSVSEVTHRVRRGDTLWRIANRYGTSATTLMRQNGLSDDMLQVGQTLRISSAAGN